MCGSGVGVLPRRIDYRNVRYILQFFDLANQRQPGPFRADGHFDVEMSPVVRRVHLELQQVKTAAARDAQDAFQSAVRLSHSYMKRERVHDATSSIISEFDLPGPTMGQTFASG